MTRHLYGPYALPDQITRAMATRLVEAEDLLHRHTQGRIDTVIDRAGESFLLRPAQDHLRARESALEDLIESSGDLIMVVSRGGLIVSQNRAVTPVLGYAPGVLLGRQIFHYVHEEDLPSVHAAFLCVGEGMQRTEMVRFRHRTAGGAYRSVEAVVTKLQGSETARVVFNIRATSESSPTSSARDRRPTNPPRSNQDQRRLLATISHELRTPLMPALLGLAEIEQDERFREAAPILAMIRRNLEIEAMLIEELASFVSVESHKVRLRLELLDAHTVIRWVLAACSCELESAGMEVVCALEAPAHWVQADSRRLQQVMWNLVRNAIKYSPRPGSLRITTSNDDRGHLRIEFQDHGIGIEPALLERIFDPFQQGSESTPHRAEGLGLGLFIAKGLAEAQHATLGVSSEGEGCGSTFRLTFKTAQPPTEE